MRPIVAFALALSVTSHAEAAQPPLAWSPLGPQGGPANALFVDPANPSHLLLGTDAGGLWTSSDAGASWARRTDFPERTIACLTGDPVRPNVVYACANGVYKSTDSGATWQPIASARTAPLNGMATIAISADGATLLGAAGGAIYRSVDGGASWAATLGSGNAVMFAPFSSTRAIAAGTRASYSNDGGLTWTTTANPQGDFARSLLSGRIASSPAAPATVYAIFTIREYLPRGGFDFKFVAVYKSVDGGLNYQGCAASPGYTSLESVQRSDAAIWVDPTDSNHVIAGGDNLWQSTDGCATWQRLSDASTTTFHQGQRAVVSDPRYATGTRRVYFLTDGGVYNTADGAALPGSGFSENDTGLFVQRFSSGAAAGASRTVVGRSYDGVVRTVTSGAPAAWQQILSDGDTGSTAIDPSNSGNVYAPPFTPAPEGSVGALRRTLDGGATWDVLNVDSCVVFSTSIVRALFTLDPNNANTMLFGSDALWRSQNIRAPGASGPTWTAILPANRSLGCQQVSAIAVASGNSDVIWTARINGDVFKTTNGTAATPAWTEVDGSAPGLPRSGGSPRRIAIDPNDPNTVYVAYDSTSNNLWKTTDGGASWTLATGAGSTALPASAIRALAIHPHTPSWIYAGTDAGVFRSTDGGATWSDQGLDTVATTDLFWINTDLVAATDGGSMWIAPTTALQMVLDDPKPGQTLSDDIIVRGWTMDQAAPSGTGIDAVHVWAYPNPGSGAAPTFLGVAAFVDRPDVAAVFGDRYLHVGFELTTSSLTPGSWFIVAYAHSTVSGSFDISRAATFTAVGPESRPAMAIDSPGSVARGAFRVVGWALDAGGGTSTGVDAVHVYAMPPGGAAAFLGAATLGLARQDVANVYGARFLDSGYTLDAVRLPPGLYTLIVYARSVVTGQWSSTTRVVRVSTANDFDGDGKADLSVFRPSNGTWYIALSSTNYATHAEIQFGLAGDVPVPDDYDGDGFTDVAVYRPGTGQWFVRRSDGSFVVYTWGRPGDIPVPGDYDGDGRADIAVYTPISGRWSILLSSQGYAADRSTRIVFGGKPYDIPAPADYDGDGRTDIAIVSRSTGLWRVYGQSGAQPVRFPAIPVPGDYDGDGRADFALGPDGLVPALANQPLAWQIFYSSTGQESDPRLADPGDVIVPADYDGDGLVDIAVFHRTHWLIRTAASSNTTLDYQWGLPGDSPTVASASRYARIVALRRDDMMRRSDFDGDTLPDLAVFRPSTGEWFIRESHTNYASSAPVRVLGQQGDIPVPGDYDGDGLTDPAVYRPSTGMWLMLLSGQQYAQAPAVVLGSGSDVPVPGDYDGDGTTDIAVYHPATGVWDVQLSAGGVMTFTLGLSGDLPAPFDYDFDGKTDPSVFRPSDGTWHVLQSSNGAESVLTFGLSGDILVPGRYGDSGGRVVYRPANSEWFAISNGLDQVRPVGLQNGTIVTPGRFGDIPVPGDYDGDGLIDAAIYRPSTGEWDVRPSNGADWYTILLWGLPGDIPVTTQAGKS